MARILTFESAHAVVQVTAVVSYASGWHDAITKLSSTKLAEPESVTELSPAISQLQIDSPSMGAPGIFHDDPRWDSFMQSLDEYRNQIDAAERALD